MQKILVSKMKEISKQYRDFCILNKGKGIDNHCLLNWEYKYPYFKLKEIINA